ncbi:peptidase A4 family-domain-containing protein [Amanita rubescens]|nr:peptidase A4 family-domain-containing protein [Amanita rubescens]
MVFTSLLVSVLLAAAALAAPSTPTESRVARRKTEPLEHLASSVTNTSNVVYSSNWAGAVWDTYPSGTFTAVTGTFTVSTPSSPDGSASAWVGIDGDTCVNAILQTGIDFTYQNGAVSYQAWYEWYPDFAHNFNNIAINSGDVIKLTVTASSTTSGTAVIENLTNGQQVSQQLSSSHALCEQNAEWIVEDYSQGGRLVPFCNFGTVAFTNAYATTSTGSQITPNGATIIDIEQKNKVLTSVTENSNGVTIQYV